MDVTNISLLISALRTETEKCSISPENVGYLLQVIVDFCNDHGLSLSETVMDLTDRLNLEIANLNAKDSEQDIAIADTLAEVETNKSDIAKLQGDVSIIGKKNATQDAQIQGLNDLVEQNVANVEGVVSIANTNKENINTLQGDVSANASAIDTLQKNAVAASHEADEKNSEQDEAITNALEIAEQANVAAESAGASAEANKSNIAKLQGDVSANASAIDTLQKNAVAASHEADEKNGEQDQRISLNESNISLHYAELENHIRDFETDVVGNDYNDGKGTLFKRVISLETEIEALKVRVTKVENSQIL